MFELAEILKKSGLEADPNGVLADLVQTANTNEEKMGELSTEVEESKSRISGLSTEINKLNTKNDQTHIKNQKHRQEGASELQLQREDLEGRMETQRLSFEEKSTTKDKEIAGLLKASKTSVTELETLRKTHSDAVTQLDGLKGKELRRRQDIELDKLKAPVPPSLKSVVYDQVVPFMQEDESKKGKFSIADHEGEPLKKDDGTAVSLADLINDVKDGGKFVEKTYPDAFTKVTGQEHQTLLTGGSQTVVTNENMTPADAEGKRQEVLKRLDL